MEKVLDLFKAAAKVWSEDAFFESCVDQLTVELAFVVQDQALERLVKMLPFDEPSPSGIFGRFHGRAVDILPLLDDCGGGKGGLDSAHQVRFSMVASSMQMELLENFPENAAFVDVVDKIIHLVEVTDLTLALSTFTTSVLKEGFRLYGALEELRPPSDADEDCRARWFENDADHVRVSKVIRVLAAMHSAIDGFPLAPLHPDVDSLNVVSMETRMMSRLRALQLKIHFKI